MEILGVRAKLLKHIAVQVFNAMGVDTDGKLTWRTIVICTFGLFPVISFARLIVICIK